MTKEEITRVRHAMDLSQKEMAAKLGMTVRGYRRYETGESVISMKAMLAVDRLWHLYTEGLG